MAVILLPHNYAISLWIVLATNVEIILDFPFRFEGNFIIRFFRRRCESSRGRRVRLASTSAEAFAKTRKGLFLARSRIREKD